MGTLTVGNPKCLVRLAGRSLFDWQLAALRAAGCSEIAVVGGYLAEQLEIPGIRTFHNEEWATTNMVASLLCAGDWFDRSPVVVSYSDIVYRPQIVCALLEAAGDPVITFDREWRSLWSERFEDPMLDAESFAIDANGRLIDIGRRGARLEEVAGQYMGLLRIGPEMFDRIESLTRSLASDELVRLDMTALLRRLMSAGISIQTVAVDGGWCEVDSVEDLEKYEARLASSGHWSHDFRWE